MIEFIAHILITTALLMLVSSAMEGIEIKDWGAALFTAIILGFVNALIKPLMILLTLPLTVITFGLFLLVVNGLMLQLAAALSPGVKVEGCGTAILGALLLSILNVLVSVVIGPTSTTVVY